MIQDFSTSGKFWTYEIDLPRTARWIVAIADPFPDLVFFITQTAKQFLRSMHPWSLSSLLHEAGVFKFPGLKEQRASLLGARALLVAPGLTTSNKKLLGTRASPLLAN